LPLNNDGRCNISEAKSLKLRVCGKGLGQGVLENLDIGKSKIDDFVKSRKSLENVIPAKAGIQ